ncbi:type II toxin-antitoxin system VapC family toxin [Rhodohalobacter sp. SW132]|uniref:type II toxin-antitoxin system VapC family toxin n=1 Tax=Rhodohalobacter sp. SW132 TaxID=2293433 RepID=UPI000E25E5E6|nr:type II toxin-antitoxin system VapC family toxin [Rhodohalobacter sp. SW132]REL38855.1 type II toxin-antitoxin system VapC family toxin [Rhodohalobacter sp. SW132]
MNVLDSSAWLAFFADEKNAEIFRLIVLDTKKLFVPTICIYEVFKVILRESDESSALFFISVMQKARIINIDFEISLNAAKLNSSLKLPMADSMILASANKVNATLWTQDSDFKEIESVRYYPKK